MDIQQDAHLRQRQQQNELAEELKVAKEEYAKSLKEFEESARVVESLRATLESQVNLTDEAIKDREHHPTLKGILRRETFKSEVLHKCKDKEVEEVEGVRRKKSVGFQDQEEEGVEDNHSQEFIEQSVQYVKEFKEEEDRLRQQRARIRMLSKKVKFTSSSSSAQQEEGEEASSSEEEWSDEEDQEYILVVGEEETEDDNNNKVKVGSGSEERLGQRVRRGTKSPSGEFRGERRGSRDEGEVKPTKSVENNLNRLGQKVRRGTKSYDGEFKANDDQPE